MTGSPSPSPALAIVSPRTPLAPIRALTLDPTMAPRSQDKGKSPLRRPAPLSQLPAPSVPPCGSLLDRFRVNMLPSSLTACLAALSSSSSHQAMGRNLLVTPVVAPSLLGLEIAGVTEVAEQLGLPSYSRGASLTSGFNAVPDTVLRTTIGHPTSFIQCATHLPAPVTPLVPPLLQEGNGAQGPPPLPQNGVPGQTISFAPPSGTMSQVFGNASFRPPTTAIWNTGITISFQSILPPLHFDIGAIKHHKHTARECGVQWPCVNNWLQCPTKGAGASDISRHIVWEFDWEQWSGEEANMMSDIREAPDVDVRPNPAIEGASSNAPTGDWSQDVFKSLIYNAFQNNESVTEFERLYGGLKNFSKLYDAVTADFNPEIQMAFLEDLKNWMGQALGDLWGVEGIICSMEFVGTERCNVRYGPGVSWEDRDSSNQGARFV
ncbi:hypothetical protein M427DRAFT_44870 [Gonapodya prolifera JEL478]|uniref:Uncharacterized protein n=1 Tax=Gonapodya prolifera (strain JEL478) TaxID=1344416 RepID=A0A139ADD2_GONPJ|nr:hypothetical protein M427DRAFT_44870 [Gonapodya prolifera JEL478]|eukprot:KXS14669.1 hypothetical protein M427DRAFT_44870 [Gonapodya prolifera JEL478]